MDATAADIQHDAAAHRFSVEVDGHAAYVEYEPEGDGIVITHTIVPKAIGGRGIAAALVKAAVTHARSAGWTVRSMCSYASSWMDKHAPAGDQDGRTA